MVLSGCGTAEQSEPMKQLTEHVKRYPEPTVTVNGQGVPLMHGETNTQELPVDIIPTVAPPGAKVVIRFKQQPENIRLEQWKDGERVRRTLSRNNTFTLPEEQGVYVYNLYADWSDLSQSLDTHTFSIEVR